MIEGMSRILDGNRVGNDIRNQLKPRIAALAVKGRPPGLAVVLVGHNPASEIYVGNKVVGNISVPMGREELDSFLQVWESFLHKVR